MKAAARAIIALAALLTPAPALFALHFRDGPPPRVTGGFGEDSCTACHFDHPPNDGAGRLTLAGLPERYLPGKAYELELRVERPGMKVAGFQLVVRLADGTGQAGRIAVPAADEARARLLEDRGLQFAHHSTPASPAAGEDGVRWTLSWTAPEQAVPVTLHAAAVAGDGDDSQAGDFVYTLARTALP